MFFYFFKRLLLVVPTLFCVLLVNFLLLKQLPGNPFDHLTSKIYGGTSGHAEVTNFNEGALAYGEKVPDHYGLSYGISENISYGAEFFLMAKRYLSLDFGTSYFRDATVLDLILEKLPVSLWLGLGTLVVSYALALFLGLRAALVSDSLFDRLLGSVLAVFYAIPNFLLATLLILFFAGGVYWDWFPLKGLVSEEWETFPWGVRLLDLLHHMVLPFFSVVMGGLAGLVFLVKVAALDALQKPHITTLYAYGNTRKQVMGHVRRPVLLVLLSHIPHSFIRIFFMGNLVVEIIFSLDGLGLLMFQASLERDYPVVLGSLFIFTCLGLLVQLMVDLLAPLLDPRIHFKRRTH